VCLAALQVDSQVSASVYYTASLYHKQQKEYAHYYRQGPWVGLILLMSALWDAKSVISRSMCAEQPSCTWHMCHRRACRRTSVR
jgi:hypothetical protein